MVAACVAIAGCGNSGSNDNGVSFRFLGVFQEVQDTPGSPPVLPTADNHPGDTGREISLSQTTSIPNDLNGDGDVDGGFLGMENNLALQSLNVQGVHVQIFIKGARLPNPVATDFVPLTITLGPAQVAQTQTATNEAFAQTLFVAPKIMAFLNQNQTLLPATPFSMDIIMRLTAIDDAGDTFDSNEITYTVNVLP